MFSIKATAHDFKKQFTHSYTNEADIKTLSGAIKKIWTADHSININEISIECESQSLNINLKFVFKNYPEKNKLQLTSSTALSDNIVKITDDYCQIIKQAPFERTAHSMIVPFSAINGYYDKLFVDYVNKLMNHFEELYQFKRDQSLVDENKVRIITQDDAVSLDEKIAFSNKFRELLFFPKNPPSLQQTCLRFFDSRKKLDTVKKELPHLELQMAKLSK